MVYGTYDYSIHGVYKPTYNWGVTLYKSHESPAFLRRFLTESAAFFVAGAGDGMPVWLQYCGRGLGPPLGPGDPPKVGIFIF